MGELYGPVWMSGHCECGARLAPEEPRYCDSCDENALNEICFRLGLPPTRENVVLVVGSTWWQEAPRGPYGPGYEWLEHMGTWKREEVLGAIRHSILKYFDGVPHLDLANSAWISVFGGGVIAPTLTPPVIPIPKEWKP